MLGSQCRRLCGPRSQRGPGKNSLRIEAGQKMRPVKRRPDLDVSGSILDGHPMCPFSAETDTQLIWIDRRRHGDQTLDQRPRYRAQRQVERRGLHPKAGTHPRIELGRSEPAAAAHAINRERTQVADGGGQQFCGPSGGQPHLLPSLATKP